MSDPNLGGVSTTELASTSPEKPKPSVVTRMDDLAKAHSDWVNELNRSKGEFEQRQRADITHLSTEVFQNPPKSPDAARYSELYNLSAPIEHLDLSKEEEYKQLLESVTAPNSKDTNERVTEERYFKAEALFDRTFGNNAKPEDAAKILKANPEILHSPKVQQSIKEYMDTSLFTAPQYLNAETSRPYLNEVFDSVLSEGSPLPDALKEATERKQNILLGIKIQRDLTQNPIGTPEQHNKKREELLAKTNQRLKSTGNQEITLHEGVSSGKVDAFKRKYKEVYGTDLRIGTDGYFQASLSLAEQAKDNSNSDKTRKTAEALAIGMAIVQPIERTKKESHQCSKDQTLTVLFTDLDHPEESSVQKLRGNRELHALFSQDDQLEHDYGFLRTQNEAAVRYKTKKEAVETERVEMETNALAEAKKRANDEAQASKDRAAAEAMRAWQAEQQSKFTRSSEYFPQKDRVNVLGIGFGGKVPDLDAAGHALREAIRTETDPVKKAYLQSIKF